ncbi:phospholipase A2 inhibitor gamma subunit B-like [Pseudophryne corroboree]|uniref:phospholipase A2 inhibitor gamma subunit B-like n=1 Tax=Pseudophryne corroboree TaxID=495146 RepID=UPI003081337A
MANPKLLFFFILSALAATGYSLSCVKCTNFNGTLCSGSTVNCGFSDAACASTHAVTSSSDGLRLFEVFDRGCRAQKFCSKQGSVSVLNTTTKTSVSCCSTNKCSPPMPVLPPDNFNKNGITCMTCADNKTEQCHSDVFVECLGNERKCISQVTTVTEPVQSSSSWSGCATKDICDGIFIEAPKSIAYSTRYACTNGSSGLCFNLLLLLILSIPHLYLL